MPLTVLGVRNPSVYIYQTRHELGLPLAYFARLLEISPFYLFQIELGGIPPEIAVKHAVAIRKYKVVLSVYLKTIGALINVMLRCLWKARSRIRYEVNFMKLLAKKECSTNGQLKLFK